MPGAVIAKQLIHSYLIASIMLPVAPMSAGNWPDFRGPRGDGQARRQSSPEPAGLPLRWSDTENVVWKTPVPHVGWSTPVVMNEQIWLTTATLKGHDFFVVCVDANSGNICFNERLFHADNPEPLGNPLNSYASPSPVIEPSRVYVHFGSYGTACLDTRGSSDPDHGRCGRSIPGCPR
ncbi:MAG: hypothetical protein ACYTGS_15790 [Planctomycetota bacterium]|jgi:hypothetical protein